MGVYQSFQKSLNNVLDFFQALSLVVDYTYYGRWTSSVLNLLIYNVLGGGESHLYGTEGPLYYLKNGFNNFNFCFILALLFVGVLPFARKKYAPDLFLVVSPIYIWLAFMSLQPHKEERLDLFRHSIYFPAVLFISTVRDIDCCLCHCLAWILVHVFVTYWKCLIVYCNLPLKVKYSLNEWEKLAPVRCGMLPDVWLVLPHCSK